MEHDLGMQSTVAKARRDNFKAPKPDAVRLLAFDILTEVNRNEGYSNLLLPAALNASNFEDRDRNLTTELVYGTLRMQGKHDWILAQISDRPWSEVDAGIVDISRMGVHQIHELRIPDHAAVSATVEVARKRLGESKASFVNALLRSVTRKSVEEWFAPLEEMSDLIEKLSIQYSHPQWIISTYFDLLKNWQSVEAELATNNIPALPTLVSWPGYSTQADLVELGAEPTVYSQLGARLKGNPANLELIQHRLAGVQDEGSQLVATVFAAAASGDSWLDLCAGPGGKAALLSSIAKRRGINFIANELSHPRAALVRKVVHGATVWCGDGRDVAQHGQSFDAVIVDAPCTGLGALRRRPEVRWRRSLAHLRELTSLQRELLDSAVSVVNPGGLLGYATCSPHLAETTVQVIDILRKHPELEQVEIAEFLPANLKDAVRAQSMSLWTHKHGTDAMFLALLRKKEHSGS